MQKLLILAALTAASFGPPAFAQSAPTTASVVVPHQDLDLRTPVGNHKLDRRIWRAVVEVCGTAPHYDLEGKNAVRECRRETRQIASAQADRVIAGATRDGAIRVSSVQK